MTLATVRAIDPVAAWAIARTLPLEGGLVDNPHDPGGVTDHGVSLRWALAEIAAHPDEIALFDIDHDGVVDAARHPRPDPDHAADIYFAWWKPGWYGRLSPAQVAWKCFDIAVNTGPKRAAIDLAEGAGAVSGQGRRRWLGRPRHARGCRCGDRQAPGTRASVAVNAIRLQQAAFYRGLVAAEAGLGVFLKGWLNRAAA
jgi:hypothetical protein